MAAGDHDGEQLAEVLSLLPSYRGKLVLELGAGIGRVTGELTKEADHVIALDLIESVIKKNENINGHHKNISFICADVTSPELKIEDNSIDLVVSNWLLMNLSDEEVEKVVQRIVNWVKVGGHIFFRESCCHQYGDSKKKVNPPNYREPRFYTKLLASASEFMWKTRKVKIRYAGYGKRLSQQKMVDFKDSWIMFNTKPVESYAMNASLERVLLAPVESRPRRNLWICWILNLARKCLMLDVELEGVIFIWLNNSVHVVGIDLSINMVSFAIERAVGRKCLVEFEVADCTTKEYPDYTFDVIYSRDTILHIQDKPALFRSFFKWLKPGGKVLISDYCRSPGEPSEEFAAYIKQRGYDLHDVKAYGQMLENAGFHDVIAEDRTDQFLRVLQKELAEVEKNKEAFLADFTQEDYDDIVNGWNAKLKRSSAGEQRWGLFRATK